MLERSYGNTGTPRRRARFTVLGLILAAGTLAIVVPSAGAATAVAATGATSGMSTSVLGSSTPEAAAAPSNCPSGALCGYTGANYTGSEGELFGDNPDLNVAGDIWNNVASIYNNGASDNVTVYRGENYSSDGGHEACLYRQTGFPDMQAQLPGLYHHIWSNFWIATPCT